MANGWHTLPVSLTELCINTTLRCGQSFRWRKSTEDEWSCTLHGRLISLKQDQTHLHYRAIYPSDKTAIKEHLPTPPLPSTNGTDKDDTPALINHYFNLKPNLGKLYQQWAKADANFAKKAPKFTGIRILKQDAWEALVGFICSSNNNIARISQMVEKLCINYGPLITTYDGKKYYDLPPPSALIDPKVEGKLRELGFGYRAKYIWKTAVMVHEKGGIEWLNGLRNPESPVLGKPASPAGPLVDGGREGYRAAHEQLLELQGVGPKVADCVSLMGLGWGESVPVDTHVWQIAQRDYKFGRGKHSSLTKATYDAVANKFRSLWGLEAGWAHSVLFTADLKAFSERLVKKEEDTTIKSEVVEEDGAFVKVEEETTVKVAEKRVFKAEEDEEKQVIVAEETTERRTKRRKRT